MSNLGYFLLEIIFVILITLAVAAFDIYSQNTGITYEDLYCEYNITIPSKKFKIWMEEQKLKIMKGEKKKICE